MPDIIDGPIDDMRDLNPTIVDIDDGQIWRSRETSVPKRESTFVWDPTAYVGPLYNSGQPGAPDEVPQYVGFAPDFTNQRDGSQGVWRWMTPPAGSIDAERVYGISPYTGAADNSKFFRRMVDEVLASDRTWPNDEKGDGDSWTVLLPAGTIELDQPIIFNRKTLPSRNDPENFPQCEYDDERVTVAGRMILQGQGASTTVLKYIGLNPAVHAFRVGPLPDDELPQNEPERHVTGCIRLLVGRVVFRDLALEAATDANYAVLRLAQARGHNLFENVDIVQRGNGHGLDATELIFTQFIQVNIRRATGDSPYGGTLAPYSGRGLWLHTDDAPYLISGQTVLNRVSVFGSFNEGIYIGDNKDGSRLVGSIAGQFINAEACSQGLVIGSGAINVDFSVVWLEANQVCGMRIFDGAKDVTLRRIYTLHTPPTVLGALSGGGSEGGEGSSESGESLLPAFTAEIILGKEGGTAGENSYSGVVLDGIYQHFVYGPVVRLFHAGPESAIRSLTIRDVNLTWYRDTSQGPLHPREYEEGAGGSVIQQGLVYPFTDAIIKVQEGDYGGLTVENIRSDNAGSLPRQDSPSGSRIVYVDHPESVDRMVFCGPYAAQVSYGLREIRKATPALRERRHSATASIRASDPTYHRVTTTNAVTLTLPDIALDAGNMVSPEGRIGLEYHVLKVVGGSAVTVKGVTNQPIKGLGVTNDQMVLGSAYEFVRVRSVEESGNRFWEVIALGTT